MTKKKNIEPGYQLHINTWDNDGDNKTTQIISGLSEQNLKFYIDLAKRFKCKDWPKNKGCRGNGANEKNEHFDAIVASAKAFPPEGDVKKYVVDELLDGKFDDKETCDMWPQEKHNWAWEFLTDDVLGRPDNFYCENYANFTKAYEDHKVYFVPGSIQDVTDKFK